MLGSVANVSARLGRVLSDQETTQVEYLLAQARAVVSQAADMTVPELEEIAAPVVPLMVVELVCRAMANPAALMSENKTLGAFSVRRIFHPTRSAQIATSLLLTGPEKLMLRQALYGTLTTSVPVESHISDIYDALIGS
jgi:hypothetical protein